MICTKTTAIFAFLLQVLLAIVGAQVGYVTAFPWVCVLLGLLANFSAVILLFCRYTNRNQMPRTRRWIKMHLFEAMVLQALWFSIWTNYRLRKAKYAPGYGILSILNVIIVVLLLGAFCKF